MRIVISLIAIFMSSAVIAISPSVPKEFIGVWVPVGSSCQDKNKLDVKKDSVYLYNGSDKQQFGNIDICYSCEGGIRYSGEVVWLTPEFNTGGESTFTVYFNANEELGVTVVEMQNSELMQRFPIHNVKLHKCN